MAKYKYENDQAGNWLKKKAAQRKRFFARNQKQKQAAERRLVREANKRI